jgi:hypothetical protein
MVYLDQLWMQLQYADARGNFLFQLVRRTSSNPFVVTCMRYTEMVTTQIDLGHFKPLFYYFDHDDVECPGQLVDDVRQLAASLCCQITWRCIWLFEGLPYRLILIVHPQLSEDQQKEAARKFKDLHRCELDPNCSEKVLAWPRPAR